LFTGDSLDVLRLLSEVPEYAAHYRGKVKLVYIDPPFNTGQAFTHYDDWMSHSTWLSFMRDRLLLIKELLAADGSVWVHLDDVEAHRMRCVLDEVFGAENFVATVVWEKVYAPRNDAKQFSTSHDVVFVYSKSPGWVLNRHPRQASHNTMYKNPDGDPKGPWTSGDYTMNKTKEERPNLWYSVIRPADGAVIWPAAHLTWRFSQERHAENVEDGAVWWGKNGLNATPRFKRRLDAVPEIVPTTIWNHSEVGHTDGAKKEIKALFPSSSSLFSTPKPERLLERVIHIGSNPGDIVLDCFAGSGTAAAVAHKMGRRWVTAEILPETVRTFTSPRLQKVVAGEDPGGITESVEWAGGGGFSEVTVAPSMYELTPVGVMLADWATNGRFARAVAGQLGFVWQTKKHAPFCGVRGRMRLAVFDGAVGVEEAADVVAALAERERVTIVAKVVLPGVGEFLSENSRGSRVKKAPRDLLTGQRTRPRRSRSEGNS
jgi:adenine-specific DNA-methyltransferase